MIFVIHYLIFVKNHDKMKNNIIEFKGGNLWNWKF